MSTKELEPYRLLDHEIKMWNEIYLKSLYRYIEDRAMCPNFKASEDADDAIRSILQKNKNRTLWA
tara:strand:- start:323 stop:517 length:195 start_codon:yes stop_codon:yes gene_type:complete